MKNKNEIITNYRKRIEKGSSEVSPTSNLNDHREAVLLGELQIAQLELEMQNDELAMAIELLEAERTKFEGFFSLAPTSYFIVDHLGLIEEVNNTGLTLLKISHSKVIGERLQSFLFPEDYILFHDFLSRLIPGGNKGMAVVRLIDSTGKLLYTRMEGIALADKFSDKTQFYLTLIDITESRLAEIELKDTTKHLELTLSASGIGTWNVDPESGRLFLDQYGLSLIGFDKEGFDGDPRTFFDLVHPDDRKLVKEVSRNAFLHTQDVELEFRLQPRNQSLKTMMLKGLKVEFGNSEPHLVGIIVDITKAKQVEETRRQLEREKQKIVYEATFIAQEKERERISSALHDSVCQLLYGIRLELQSTQLTNEAPLHLKGVNELLTQAIKETRELSYELTPSILRDFGLVAGLEEMASRLTTKSFRIITKIKSKADQLSDQMQLSIFRVTQELLNNCIKHAGASRAEIMLCTENQEITLIVSDNGIGFKADDATLFKGSGLRAIRNRIFLLNGSIAIKSNKKGTQITVKINQE